MRVAGAIDVMPECSEDESVFIPPPTLESDVPLQEGPCQHRAPPSSIGPDNVTLNQAKVFV